ncbi:hypothetical protein A9Q84_06265 [Halobacteriovorax marinus]|uniref:Uncharacterized protein n=1 Tax=Halobacteriovorax marinus TaxID=97084 RepID=A0A1Y5F9I2_9BACT|nr:hypothetical protein A9Q84_06265 [Halobacteriovorax marinus]
MLKILASLFTLSISFQCFALVDYSEVEDVKSSRRAAPNRNQPAIIRKAPAQKASSNNSGGGGNFELSTLYEQQQVSAQTDDGDLSKVSFVGHFQTDYNLYLDVSYWMANATLNSSETSGDYEQGRPKVILGFNWLRFGKAQEMSTVDLFAGGVWKGSDSVASTRTDKIIGIETSKRFYIFALALGYEYHLTGTPESESETAIGNIGILKTSLGWMVSGDISFVLEAGMVKIDSDSNLDRANRLTESTQFSYLRPSALLGLSRSVSLEIGGVFRTRRARDVDTLLGAKLWNVPGAYGNSLFAGIRLSI